MSPELDTSDWPSFADGPYLVGSTAAVKAMAQLRRAKGERNFADPLLEQVAELLELRDEDRRRSEGDRGPRTTARWAPRLADATPTNQARKRQMTAKEKALASIRSARLTLAEVPRSREASIAATKLDEAAHWLGAMSPQPISYTRTGDVLIAEAALGSIRIEIDDDVADCALIIEGCTPINVTVRKPHDRSVEAEAADVMAGLYWSRARSLDGAEGHVSRV